MMLNIISFVSIKRSNNIIRIDILQKFSNVSTDDHIRMKNDAGNIKSHLREGASSFMQLMID